MKFSYILLCITLLIWQANAQTSNYCAATLCRTGTHVACANRNVFAASCPKDARLVTISNLIFVNEHNRLRNQLALGNVGTFDEAMRMGTIQWNEELATLAQISLKRCVPGNDECRNTAAYSRVSQNRYTTTRVAVYNTTAVAIEAVQAWFNQNTLMDVANVASYTADVAYQNFANIACDKVTRIGCAIADWTFERSKQVNVLCNYNCEPVVGSPLYVDGCPLAQCLQGRNNDYFGLCAATEVIDPN